MFNYNKPYSKSFNIQRTNRNNFYNFNFATLDGD